MAIFFFSTFFVGFFETWGSEERTIVIRYPGLHFSLVGLFEDFPPLWPFFPWNEFWAKGRANIYNSGQIKKLISVDFLDLRS